MSTAGPRAPLPLRIAAALVAVEGLAVFGYGVFAAVDSSRKEWVVAASTAACFCLIGAGLVACAGLLLRLRSWARGPVLLAQLVCLGLAWDFRHGDTWPAAVLLALAGAAGLVGLLHPRTITALDRDGSA